MRLNSNRKSFANSFWVALTVCRVRKWVGFVEATASAMRSSSVNSLPSGFPCWRASSAIVLLHSGLLPSLLTIPRVRRVEPTLDFTLGLSVTPLLMTSPKGSTEPVTLQVLFGMGPKS